MTNIHSPQRTSPPSCSSISVTLIGTHMPTLWTNAPQTAWAKSVLHFCLGCTNKTNLLRIDDRENTFVGNGRRNTSLKCAGPLFQQAPWNYLLFVGRKHNHISSIGNGHHPCLCKSICNIFEISFERSASVDVEGNNTICGQTGLYLFIKTPLFLDASACQWNLFPLMV